MRSLGASWHRPAQPPHPWALAGAAPSLCCLPPRPCAETPRLCSTPGSCKDSFPAREAGPRGPGSLWCVWVTTCWGRAGRERRAPSHACPRSVGGPRSLGRRRERPCAILPALPSPLSQPVSCDSGWEAGNAGASAAERLLSQAQRWFSFLCYIWSLRSQECLPRGENPEGAGSR